MRSSAQCNLLTVITNVLSPMLNKSLIGNSKIANVAEAAKNNSFSLKLISILLFGEDSSVEAGGGKLAEESVRHRNLHSDNIAFSDCD